ncbi:hypothetical protein QFC20_006924 [Naganishia adeliensis]|uniref:Uncharacterized protein n=1 Tax=Naganishia adeliensis TaxID=92952 RepID=A0ACC2V5I0_9TREE|nr:hypothetical protein QFC20_006924 [Naganishia adeliensis]
MIISSDTSAPLFVVVGSTGVQGRSVIKAPQESPKPYRIRAVTRDVSKDPAKELDRIGCEVVQGDADDRTSLNTVFVVRRGEDVKQGLEHELQQGKNQFGALWEIRALVSPSQPFGGADSASQLLLHNL